MRQSFRDQVRLRAPRLLDVYQRQIAPRLRRGDRTRELAAWAGQGLELVSALGAHGIRFEQDGVWIDDGLGLLWAYEPGPFSSTLWAEQGVNYEQAEIEALAALLKDGGTLVDVGANIGLHSVTLTKRIPGLSVQAFEPVSATLSLLERNAAKNGVSGQIRTHHLALSDHDGELRLTTRYQAGNFVVPEGADADAQMVERVPTRRLDDVLGSDTPVTAIKCDVEGAELDVLRGATATLETHHPAILIEIDRRWAARYGNSAEQVFEFLHARGYSHRRFIGERLSDAAPTLGEDLQSSANFLFTKA
ncbi:MAG: FkbM family methyltransferase [Solirubrobacterales bacterium]|nr:FkbM family methyltransferase [Solirubrobacterales bacterium]